MDCISKLFKITGKKKQDAKFTSSPHKVFYPPVFLYSVQFSHSVLSDSLHLHEPQHTRPWTAAHQASLSITNSWCPPKPMCIESVMPSNHLILCRSLLLLPSAFPSIRVFSNGSTLGIRWLKYWIFGFNISPSNEHLGLISFRMDWLDLLAVQGTLESSPTPQSKSINSY